MVFGVRAVRPAVRGDAGCGRPAGSARRQFRTWWKPSTCSGADFITEVATVELQVA